MPVGSLYNENHKKYSDKRAVALEHINEELIESLINVFKGFVLN